MNNKNNRLFPSDFFNSINTKISKNEIPHLKSTQTSSKNKIFVDLRKEYEEDKELLDLLEGKRKKNIFY